MGCVRETTSSSHGSQYAPLGFETQPRWGRLEKRQESGLLLFLLGSLPLSSHPLRVCTRAFRSRGLTLKTRRTRVASCPNDDEAPGAVRPQERPHATGTPFCEGPNTTLSRAGHTRSAPRVDQCRRFCLLMNVIADVRRTLRSRSRALLRNKPRDSLQVIGEYFKTIRGPAPPSRLKRLVASRPRVLSAVLQQLARCPDRRSLWRSVIASCLNVLVISAPSRGT